MKTIILLYLSYNILITFYFYKESFKKSFLNLVKYISIIDFYPNNLSIIQ